MKRSQFLLKLEEKDKGVVFSNGVFIQPLRENRISIKNQEFDVTPDIQSYLTNTKLTTKFSDNVEKETVFDIFLNLLGSMMIYLK